MKFIRGEIIGLPIKVVDSLNPHLVGIAGKVADETKNMIKIETKTGMKMVEKKTCTFEFGTGKKVDGKRLVGRPEQRLKKR
jgi:ribonuclease P protein subunit POP4